MQPDREREREIFNQACELESAAERARFLESACGGDHARRARLENLLEMQAAAETFFRPEEIDLSAAVPSQPPATHRLGVDEKLEGAGAVFGRYRLVERIGEGGFGRVYRAEQMAPVRRSVALKVVKVGMDTREVMARFEGERQALALMDHPNVAHVLDAGATDTGRPYFVMELVEGIPITEYCDRNRLTLHERIELVLPVCHALQHAHQKGIIHRDLKPSNVLVAVTEGRPLPKVIDFGVAKAMQQPASDQAFATAVGQWVGTPAYMSPEQAGSGSRDVDTRSDVYSLGVILYELFCGQPPFDALRIEQAGLAGFQQILREEEPPAPSARLKASPTLALRAAAARRDTPPHLIGSLRGELDWVVMKAMDKDRDRRYATANALARDLERLLHEEPIVAAPPGVTYRARKFVRRHRHAVAAAAGILIALVGGLLLATQAFLEAREQRNLARASAQRAGVEARNARLVAYASDMNLARHALERSNLGLARDLLDRHRPAPGQEDLRGWEWRYLTATCQSDARFSLGRLDQAVVSLAVSVDGRRLAAAGMDGTVLVWDLPGRRRLFCLTNAGTAVAFAPDARWLAIAAPTGGVTLQPLDTAQAAKSLPDPDPMSSVAYSADGQRVFAYSSRGILCGWDVDSGRSLGRHGGFPAAGRHTGDFVVGDAWLILGGSDGRVRQVDPRDGRVLQTWVGHGEAITALALSPDRQRVATAGGYSERAIRIWRTHDGSLEATLDGPQAWLSSLAYSPDGRMLAAAGGDQTIRVWNLDSGEPPRVFRGHLHEVWSLVFLPDGRTLASGGKDGVLNVWDLEAPPRPADPVDLPWRSLVFVGSGGDALGLDPTGVMVGWPGTNTSHTDAPESLGGPCTRLAVHPGRDWIATADAEGGLNIWETRPLALRQRLSPEAGLGTLSHLEFTADGRFLVLVLGGRSVRLLDTATWYAVATWSSPHHPLDTVDVSPDGRFLAAGGDTVVLLDLANGRVVREFRAHQQPTDAVAFSPDGQMLATGSQEGLAKLWAVTTGEVIAVLRGHLLGVHAVTFSPDGRRLVTGSVGSEAVKLWDLATHQEVLSLSWPGQLAVGLAFAPDGSVLAGSTANSRVRLWRGPPSDRSAE